MPRVDEVDLVMSITEEYELLMRVGTGVPSDCVLWPPRPPQRGDSGLRT